MSKQDPSGVALVVGAGGPTGGPFIRAAIDEIEQRTGWLASSADEIIGTSAGAFVAAGFTEATAPDPTAITSLADLANGKEFAPTKRLRVAWFLRLLGGRFVAAIAPMSRPFADYTVPTGPFHPNASAVTVRRRSGDRVQHRFVDATDVEAVVRASAAIPGLNQPVKVDGEFHVDGAVHSSNNVDLVSEDARVVVVISPMIPRRGGTITSWFHRAQLRVEIGHLLARGVAVIAVLPTAAAHGDRADRELFAASGTTAVATMISNNPKG